MRLACVLCPCMNVFILGRETMCCVCSVGWARVSVCVCAGVCVCVCVYVCLYVGAGVGVGVLVGVGVYLIFEFSMWCLRECRCGH